jgi:hypothetical protein
MAQAAPAGMGLAPGGRMRQAIHDDTHGLDAWDQRAGQRCFVAILNSEDWQAVTDEPPPTRPVSAADYARAGLPWFAHYGDAPALEGAARLAKLKSWAAMAKERREPVGAAADDVPITRVVPLGPAVRPVRAGQF